MIPARAKGWCMTSWQNISLFVFYNMFSVQLTFYPDVTTRAGLFPRHHDNPDLNLSGRVFFWADQAAHHERTPWLSRLGIKTGMRTETGVTLTSHTRLVWQGLSHQWVPGDSEWNVVSKIHFQVAILASAGLSQGAPQSDPSLARILQEQRYTGLSLTKVQWWWK